MKLTTANALHGHTDEDTAYLVDDYPYGFKLRTQIRYWIETTKHGDRFCSQTLNPKTGRWNKPKKSTYSLIACMYIDDETGHVEWTGVGHYTDEAIVDEFLAVMDGHLSKMQQLHLAQILGLRRAMEGVTFTVREGQRTPEEEEEQARAENVLRHRIARETENARTEIEKDGP